MLAAKLGSWLAELRHAVFFLFDQPRGHGQSFRQDDVNFALELLAEKEVQSSQKFSGPISRDIAILLLQYPISRDNF